MWQKEMCTKNAFNKRRRSRKVSKNKTKKKELHLLSAYFMAQFLLDQVSGSFGHQPFRLNELLNQKTSCQHVLYCYVPFTIATAARAHSAKWLLNFQILSLSLKWQQQCSAISITKNPFNFRAERKRKRQKRVSLEFG